jgi:hypothetical protein
VNGCHPGSSDALEAQTKANHSFHKMLLSTLLRLLDFLNFIIKMFEMNIRLICKEKHLSSAGKGQAWANEQ